MPPGREPPACLRLRVQQPPHYRIVICVTYNNALGKALATDVRVLVADAGKGEGGVLSSISLISIGYYQ